MRLDGTDAQNIGDWIQLIAIEELLHDFDIEYTRIPRNMISACGSEKDTILINGWNSFDELETYDGIQMPYKWGRAIYWGFNLEGNYIPENEIDLFKKNQPIGCRDEGTYRRLKEMGVDCYITGCPSALLKTRVSTNSQNTVFIIDIPKSAIQIIPNSIKKQAVFLSNSYPITRKEGPIVMTAEESDEAYLLAQKQLDELKEKAKLVITGRLHIASPCLGLGIPVIVLKESFDERFAWIDRYLPLYDKKLWDTIDWTPRYVPFEREKAILRDNLKSIIDGCSTEAELREIGCIYKHRHYEDYYENLKLGIEQLPKREISFCICGIAIDTITFVEAVSLIRPQWKLNAVYDIEESDVVFEGMKVRSIRKNNDNKTVCFITTQKSREVAIEHCRNEKIPYVIVDYTMHNWIKSLELIAI